jgi:hypothetical protein
MNAHDTANLLFLMNLSPQGLKDWFYQASEDDQAYAEELIAQAQLMVVDARVAQLPQYKEAQEALRPFAL